MISVNDLGSEDLQVQNRQFITFEDFSKARVLIKSINLPFEKLTVETKKYGDKKYVGFTPVEDITIVFYENTDFEVYEFFQEWYDSVFDYKTKTFKVLTDENIKYKSATVMWYTNEFLSTTEEKIIKTYRLNNLMLLGFNEVSLDQSTGTPLEWSVSLALKDVR